MNIKEKQRMINELCKKYQLDDWAIKRCPECEGECFWSKGKLICISCGHVEEEINLKNGKHAREHAFHSVFVKDRVNLTKRIKAALENRNEYIQLIPSDEEKEIRELIMEIECALEPIVKTFQKAMADLLR